MFPKYENSIVYKIVCLDPIIKDLYVGSTTNLSMRKIKHKSDCNNPNNTHYNLPVYQCIRDNGGFENWEFIVVRRYNHIKTKHQLHRKERKYIEKLNATLNQIIPTRTSKERYHEIKSTRDKILNRNKEYFLQNKDKIYAKQKERYTLNKEEILQRNKAYRDNNKQTIANNKIKYYQDNKVKIQVKKQERIICECGCEVQKVSLKRHKQSKKHLDLLPQ